MSGLVAFTGPPCPQLLDALLAPLSHRGTLVAKCEETTGSAAVLDWDRPKIGKLHTGCFGHNEERVAFAGFAFNELLPTKTQDFQHLRGSYALCKVSSAGLTIARDMTGCQVLYYAKVTDPAFGSRWMVATEPKAITSLPHFTKVLRRASLVQYLAFSFVPGRHTMLEGLYELEAGSVAEFPVDGASPRIERVFDFEQSEFSESGEQPSKERDSAWIQRTKHAISDAVEERLGSQQPVVFLSGGLDSSLVAAELAQKTSSPIRTFALHFGSKYPNELPFASQVAQRIGSQHEEVLIRPKSFLPNLRKMIWHLDEPIGDPITQPNYELAQHVQSLGCYVFNGEGGDPLFGGPKNLPMMLTHWYGVPSRDKNFRERAYLASYRRAYEEWGRILTPEFREHLCPERDLEAPLIPYFQAAQPKNFLNKLMAINIRLKGANLILPKVDRMLAAHGLTPLSPLFDDRLTRLSFEMPPRLKLRHGIEKYVLKQAYRGLLPDEVIDRPKSGMRVPVHYWFQKDMRRYARTILSKRAIEQAGILDYARVKQLLDYSTEEGPGRYGLRLWMLLTFEIWRRIVIEGEAV